MLSWGCRLVAYSAYLVSQGGAGATCRLFPPKPLILFRQVPDMAAKIPGLKAVSVACSPAGFNENPQDSATLFFV